MSRFLHIVTLAGMVMLLGVMVPMADAAPEFLAKWGSQGTENGQFEEPSGIAIDASGNVYVADRYNHRIQKFDSGGNYILKWGGNGTGNGQFDEPRGIAIDSSGNVYVVDSRNTRVQKFSSSGTYITKWGTFGLGDGQFRAPRGIAIDGSDSVYVTDNGLAAMRVQKFTNTGSYLTKWGSPGGGNGQFTNPSGVAADNSGNVYVTDTFGDRFQKFTDTGTFIATWGQTGSGPGDFQFPIGIAFGTNLWVVDESNHRIQECSTTGVYLGELGSRCDLSDSTDCVDPDGPGPLELGDGQLLDPQEVAVDSDGNIYVSDTGNHRIVKFGEASQVGIGDGDFRLIGPPLAFPNPTSSSTTVEFRLQAPESDPDARFRVDAEIYNVTGRRVRGVYSGEMAAGNRFIRWDGKLDDGQPAPPGIFFMRILVDGTDHRTAKIVRVP